MSEFLVNHYNEIKALHLIAIVAWFAALFYLPRLFVYHVDAPVGSAMSETFKVMERRLLKAIMTPAMLATWLFGMLLLSAEPGWMTGGWMHVKLTIVLVLNGFHGFLAVCVKQFAADDRGRSGRFYRVINEIPTVCLIAIIYLAIVKPF